MTDETSQSTEIKTPPTFGKRLKSAREDLRLDLKDVASQLRLRVGIIEMLEKEMYSDDTPTTFLRGYLRSYAKFLEIPDEELNSALSVEPFQPKAPPPPEPEEPQASTESGHINKILDYADKSIGTVLSNNTISESSKHFAKSANFFSRFFKKNFMRLFTFAVIFTLCYLVVTWWNAHKNSVMIPPLPETTQATTTETTADEQEAQRPAPQSAEAAEPTVPTLAEASNQDFEEEPAVFEEDSDPQPTVVSTNTAKAKQKTVLSMQNNKQVVDIYNE